MESLERNLFDSTILVVDDEPICREVTANSLKCYKNVFKVNSGQDAIEFCLKRTPSLILLDVNMPELDGYMTCKLLRSNKGLNHCPILFHTSEKVDEAELECWKAGGSDFITKPANPEVLCYRVRTHLEYRRHAEYIKSLHYRDLETRLYNRQFYEMKYIETLDFIRRYGLDLSMLSIGLGSDCDQISKFPPTSSHLFHIAQAISSCAKRSSDWVFRYLKNQFVLLLPGTPLDGARVVASAIGAQLAHLSEQQVIGVDFTVGVSSYKSSHEPTGDLLGLASSERNLLFSGTL